MLDLRGVASFADYFVVCNGESERQVQALCEAVDEGLRGNDARLLRQEGTPESGWVLLDFGDLVVHIFAPEERRYYQIERLWSKAIPVVRIQ